MKFRYVSILLILGCLILASFLHKVDQFRKLNDSRKEGFRIKDLEKKQRKQTTPPNIAPVHRAPPASAHVLPMSSTQTKDNPVNPTFHPNLENSSPPYQLESSHSSSLPHQIQSSYSSTSPPHRLEASYASTPLHLSSSGIIPNASQEGHLSTSTSSPSAQHVPSHPQDHGTQPRTEVHSRNEPTKETETIQREVISTLAGLRKAKFVTIQAPNGKFVAAVAEDFGQTHVLRRDKIWKVVFSGTGFHFKTCCHTHLSASLSGAVSGDKWDARTFETWTLEFQGNGKVSFLSFHWKYLGLSPSKAGIAAVFSSKGDKTWFTISAVQDCNDESSCWGAPQKARRSGEKTFPAVMFGSPKDINKQSDIQKSNQRAAFDCWSRIPFKSTIVFTHDTSTKSLAASHQLSTDGNYALHPSYEQPTYKALFSRALQMTDSEIVIYTNGDILYTSDLTDTLTLVHKYVEKVQKPPYKYLVVGQRINYEMGSQSFSLGGDGWEDRVRGLAKDGSLFQIDAEDYFAISRALWQSWSVPDFVVGGAAFDNWLVGKAVREGHLVVDATRTVTALHLNHGHLKGSLAHPKSEYNRKLALANGGWSRGTVRDAGYYTLWHPSTGNLTLWSRSGNLLHS